MRFSKLRLNGFKSFVDPTDLIIADGLTGVVGPNGCGKSNLLEALRWVMGENRPTAMRGGGMEDVIFAGTATRPARNFAEVSLQIDNTTRLAPATFNESDLLDVVRRITRDIGSAYKANSKDVRARDVQMLFADASTGAHSPALVRQGQISELINAKPKARRRILEEAAGISGLYARRHEGELKLRGAETNLLRVDDVIEQLGNQLSQLARQAKQAVRYKELGASLRLAEGFLLYRRWKEADEARFTAEEALGTGTVTAAQAEIAVQKTIKAREICEAALPPLRDEEAIANAVLQRLNVQKDTLGDQERRAEDTIRTLQQRIAQLSADMEREEDLNKDAGETIAQLRAEATDLDAAGAGHAQKVQKAGGEASESAAVLHNRETQLSEITEDVARLAASHQSAERFVADTQKRLSKAETDKTAANSAVTQAQSQANGAATAFQKASQDEATAIKAVAEAETALGKAEVERAECQVQETVARGARAEAEGVVNALQAEVSALAKLVERDRAQGNQVLDQVDVKTGYEKALGAALADDLKAPAVSVEGLSGWAELATYDRAPALPDGIESFGQYVTVPGVLNRRIAQVGLVTAAEGPRLHAVLLPGQRLVSLEGDLWRWDGFRAQAKDAPSAAALALEQRNRLQALQQELNSAQATSEVAQSAHQTLVAQMQALAKADQEAREARRAADGMMADAGRAVSRAEAERNLAGGRVEALALAVTRHGEDAAEARVQLREARTHVHGLEDLAAARARVEDVKLTVEASRVTMMSRRAAHDEVRREGEARDKRIAVVTKDIDSWAERLGNAKVRAEELMLRHKKAEVDLGAAIAEPDKIRAQRTEIMQALQEAEGGRKLAADNLALGETYLRNAADAERNAARLASESRESRARAEARAEAAVEAVTLAGDRIRGELETEPQTLLEQLEIDPLKMPPAEQVEAEVARLRRQRDALGAVNLRAEEDSCEVQEEFDSLSKEKADLEEAIKTLRGGIASLNKEGRERLLTAFDEVNRNFGTLFSHLFGGGEANLVLVESDDPLDAGLEILCQPPGKKLSTLSLLSGGEQTLTSMALIFAVFLANPAPICVLDEVDAPLDDANVTRFCDLLDEMTRRTDTRFLIITHHAVTMARMDRLFGVTMAEQGVSQLVSVDLKKAEQMVA
ncbi:chromosome segregation protein SMC [uncultured Planktomarina sp.]|uniref:chromosome segregation protein SMC n=1 Tax=uncultured Planktomarina sp. TaxID=1538529 RepID=UPI0032602EB5